MKKISSEPKLKCYVAAKTNLRDKSISQNGLISFAIPDLGILFRVRGLGSHYELEYMSLLSLLRFIELNRSVFEKHKIKIYSTSSLMVYQVNQNAFCQKELEKHKNLAVAYKNTFKFSLSWIPESENKAESGMLDLPPLKESLKVDLSFDTGPKIAGQNGPFGYNLGDLSKKLK
jgi:hypothetical protein